MKWLSIIHKLQSLGGGRSDKNLSYLLNDQFITPYVTGSVNGTPAEPGPGGNRLVRDVESKISILGGVETWAAQATPNYNEQDRVYSQQPIIRAFGVLAICKLRLTTDNPAYPLAFVTSTTPSYAANIQAAFFIIGGGSLNVPYNGVNGPTVAAIAVDTDYLLAIELRAAGAKWYIKGGAFTNWTKLFEHTLGSTATLYVASAGYTSVFTLDDIRSPARKFQDVPLASDSFAGANGSMDGRLTDGLGHAEANGGAGLAWTAPTWTVDGAGAAVNTPTQGAELFTDPGLEAWTSPTNLTSWTETIAGTSTVNQETTTIHGGSNAARFDIDASSNNARIAQSLILAAGSWVSVSAWVRSSVASGKNCRIDIADVLNGATQSLVDSYAQIFQVHRFTAANQSIGLSRGAPSASSSIYWDDISTKALTLSTLFSSLVLSTPNVMAECVIKTLIAGTQAGFIARLNNAATPTGGIIGYWDGADNVKLDEFTTATTWTNLLNVVKAYATGDKLVPWFNGSAWRLYHVTAAGVVTLLGSGTTTVLTGNLCGKFSTYSGNAIESINIYAVGTENQYSELDTF